MTDPTTLSLVVERTWTWHELKRSSSSTLQDCWHGPAFHNEHMCSINITSWWPFASGKHATTLDPQNSRIHQQSERPKVKWKVPQPVPFRLKFKAKIWDGELLRSSKISGPHERCFTRFFYVFLAAQLLLGESREVQWGDWVNLCKFQTCWTACWMFPTRSWTEDLLRKLNRRAVSKPRVIGCTGSWDLLSNSSDSLSCLLEHLVTFGD